MPKITRRGPSNAAEQDRSPAPQQDTGTDYASLTKMELVELARDRGLSPTGTKAELVDRLEGQDDVGEAG